MSNVDEILEELRRLNDEIAALREQIAKTYLPRAEAARQRRRTALILLVVLVGLVSTSYLTQRMTLSRVNRTTTSQCDFYNVLAEAQSTLTPKSGELAVKLLVDSRRAFLGLGCPGSLPEPTPVVRDLAARYRIELR